jgi:D-3-phosphoglycerate dehydrogenase
MKPVVFIPEPIAPCGLELLAQTCELRQLPARGGVYPYEEAAALLCDADAVIVRLWPMTADVIGRATRLKVIAKHGVGVDTIDVAAATKRGIPVVFTPTANSNAVAEHTIAILLALLRHIRDAASDLRPEVFARRNQFKGIELAGKTIVILGLGRVGRRVAQIAGAGFGMRVIGYDPLVSPESIAGLAELEPSLEAALAKSDFLSLHLPLTDQTRKLLDGRRLALLKPNCRIVNTSRGEIIDEQALVDALRSGQITGAALDVFEQEPLPSGHPFLTAPHLLLTPHIASSTSESLDRMSLDAAQGVLDVLAGRRPAHVVNPEVFNERRSP